MIAGAPLAMASGQPSMPLGGGPPPRSALVQALMGAPAPPAPPASYAGAMPTANTMLALRELTNPANGPAQAPQTAGQIAQGMLGAGATPPQAAQVAAASQSDPMTAPNVPPPPMGMGARVLNALGMGATPPPFGGVQPFPGLAPSLTPGGS